MEDEVSIVTPRNVLVVAFSYTVMLIASHFFLCSVGIFQCEIGNKFSLGEAVIPITVIFLVLFIISTVVGWIILSIYQLLKKKNLGKVPAILVLGVIVGILPSVAQDIIQGSPMSIFYVRYSDLPYVISGLVAAISGVYMTKAR